MGSVSSPMTRFSTPPLQGSFETLAQATPWNRSSNSTLRIAQMNVSLRPLEDRDLDTIYQQVTDPESVRMAAFTAEDQTDRRAFLNRYVAPAGRHKRLAPSHRCRRSNGWNDRVLPNRQSA
jgi:hypothetical protein